MVTYRKQNGLRISRFWIIYGIIILIILLFFNLILQSTPTAFRYNKEYVNTKPNILNTANYTNDLETKVPTTIFPQMIFNYKVEPVPICNVIHVGIVCAGYKSSLYVVTMLKSIYFHRNNPLHFHVMVDNIAEKILTTLFDTWAVPQVNISFYAVNKSIPDIRWIPNSHYSGLYGLLKLTFPKVIPNHVKNIIILDTDLTFMSNIAELWQLFYRFNKRQAIGVVENESNYYLGTLFKQRKTWPAIGRGFNTGVILMNLEKLNVIKWDKLWKKVAKGTASVYGAANLGDQDIINAVIKQEPNIVFHVPCMWNVQLSDHTRSHLCYSNNEIKIVHWNSPKKFHTINKDAEYFRSLYTTFLEYNGNLLRRQLYYCNNDSRTEQQEVNGMCSEFQKAQNTIWRTHIFFREFVYKPSKEGVDVTLVAQLSLERLQMVEQLCKHWEGPMSLTLYITDPELQQCIDFIDHSKILSERLNIAYHIVFKDGSYYPINYLRNVGLRNVNTPYVFLSDIDFLPMFGLYAQIKKYLIQIHRKSHKTALVIPAFETHGYRSKFPKTKVELLEMLDNGNLFTFRYDVWSKGHAPTNYNKWRSTNQTYQVKWAPDFEPYIVTRSDVTEYDSRFVGFGWNKVSHIMDLEAQGYKFIVLPKAFIIHSAHGPSLDIAKFRKSSRYRMCLTYLKEDFVKSLNLKYGRLFENTYNETVQNIEISF